MYRVKFNGYPLHDLRDERLILRSPSVRLAVGNAGAMSFIIDDGHPYANQLTRLKGVLELWNDDMRIFKGRITKDTRDFYLNREIEVEGLLACLNDSIIPPFNFPEDFENDAGYQAAAASGNVIEFFLGWLLDQHNAQVGAAQKIVLGDVTVTDPNNYISRASSEYLTTMEVVQKKLEELLGGYLLADYSGDTTVLHYYDDLPLTNVQEVEFGENLLDLVSALDSADTYTAILPIGKEGLTIAELADGEVSPGVWKSGLVIYSQEAEETIGGRITQLQKWDDVTEASNLRRKAAQLLTGEGVKTAQTITVQAADMGAIGELPRFVVGRYVQLNSTPHGFSAAYPLMELKPDLLDPGNTWITMGRTTKTATDMSHGSQNATQEKLDQAQQELQNSINGVASSLNQRIDGIEGIDGVYFYIRYSEYADGHVMTDTPDDSTLYMGTCSTSETTAPTDYRKYIWCKVRGNDGKDGTDGTPGADGSSNYFHVKYSDDGKTFTGKNELSSNVEDWKSGLIPSGGTVDSPIQSASYTANDFSYNKVIPVEPGAKYYISYGNPGIRRIIYRYDVDGNYVSSYVIQYDYKQTKFTVPDGVYYIRYMMACDAYDSDDFSSGIANGEIVPIMQNVEELGETLGLWMGTCVDDTDEDPTDFGAYKWTKIVGEDGQNGIDGADGKDGNSSYFFVKFSANANGNPMTETPQSNTKYMGVCSTTSPTAPTSYSSYKWTQCRGNDGTNGTPGQPGADGRTQYLHIKYSDDGATFTANDGEDLGAYIGTLVDFTEADSLVFGDYTWKKFTEDVDEELEEIRQTFTEQITAVVQNTETIIFSALERYVETSNFEEFQKTVEAELQVMADNITLRFTEATEHIENVNGDLQQTNELIAKHFEFTVDGLTIKAGEGAMNLHIDNDLISFEKNGQQFGHWDGVDFHTGNIIIDVNERAQFGNFAAVPRASGNLSWLKVRD
jgi:hypothetical protein